MASKRSFKCFLIPCHNALEIRQTYLRSPKLMLIRWVSIWSTMETHRRTRGAAAACCRVCLHWGFWGRRWGRAVRRAACWCGCSPTACTSPSGAPGSLRGPYPPPCSPPAQICTEEARAAWKTSCQDIYVLGKYGDLNWRRANCPRSKWSIELSRRFKTN